ncbi:conserved hypothetical protein [Thermotomaculum hydrothermale]|uniref:RCK C-terminal domain-containing protein n=1 Tax=Thermotomaculum hydrothermale TaxID=981385 RepID=A0A7R6PWB9_9BACT|nr:TrkA C-terminal domain-containing protein [Thermotomaculum hydrothermale]BBB31805.1 conserved hypothetical protein [Thermotomaculum hydrothermale]
MRVEKKRFCDKFYNVMNMVLDFLGKNQVFTLFLIISIGYLIGRIKIKGFSLESSAILFVAILAGHLGLDAPVSFKTVGLLFFVYSIGLQAGPKFFSFFKRDGFALNMLAFAIVSIGAIVTAIIIYFFNVKPEIAIGLFAGALTSTPGLAAAQEATNSPLTSTGYGIAYPFGVIGVIVFVKLLPFFIKKGEENKQENEKEKIGFIHNEVKNPAIFGKSLRELKFRTVTGCVVSRVMRGDKIFVPKPETKLLKGDIVRVVGTPENLENATNLLGGKTDREIPSRSLTVKKFVVTNREIIGKTVRDIALNSYFNATITRIRRSGIEFPAMLDRKFEWGDRVTVVGEESVMNEIKNIFGDDLKALEEGNIYAVILGMVIGILIGMIPVSFGKVISLKMGMTGGILFSGLVLSNLGKTGPIIWRAPGAIVNFVRELGLVFFLAVVGVKAGSTFAQIIHTSGFSLFLYGALITLLPMVVVLIINLIFLKYGYLRLSGIITGGMTSTPGLAAATSLSDSDTPMITYAAVYPVAMISMMLWAKILAAMF